MPANRDVEMSTARALRDAAVVLAILAVLMTFHVSF